MTRMNKLGCLLLLGVARAALASGGDADPIGPFPSTAPTISMHAFAAGHLGIIDGDFQRAYLVAAWRAIGGKPLDDPDVRQLALALREGTQPDYESSGAKVWADARTKFGPKAGANAAEAYIGPSRDASAKSGAQLLDLEYDNCVDAGSRTAAATLTARANAYGNADSNPWVAEWIHGQDAVFSNCSSGSGMPSPAPADAPPWFKQDRAYQTASALFYGGEFEAAREAFLKIAADAASPWRPLAPYLAARSDLRLGSLAVDADVRKAALDRAETELRTIAEGPSPALRPLGVAMLSRLAIERDRAGVFAALTRQVGDGAWGPKATVQVGDFLSLARHAVWSRNEDGQPAGPSDTLDAPRDGSLADWLAAMNQAGIVGLSPYYDAPKPMTAAEHARLCGALSETGPHRHAWVLVCYLSAAKLADVPTSVRAAAAALPDSDPAWATITYLELRLHMRERDAQPSAVDVPALRARFDAAIAKGDATFGADGINALRILRAPLSTSMLDFISTSMIRDVQDPQRYAWFDEIARVVSPGTSMYLDISEMLSTSVPVSALVDLSENRKASDTVRGDTLKAAWTRAALLGQDQVVTRLTPALLKAMPQQVAAISAFVGEVDPVKKRYLLARLIHTSGLSPTFSGTREDGRPWSSVGWGCTYPAKRTNLAWLSVEEARATTVELAALMRLPTATTFYGEATLAWALKTPTDPRLAADLADVVAATRMGCDGETVISKAAFKALHRLFPKSSEARRTKYYF